MQNTSKRHWFFMHTKEIEHSIEYLNSMHARAALAADPYWPKWNSPWWHMLLLHEVGQTDLIPESILSPYVEALNRIPLKIFPIQPGEMPADVDPYRGTPCHCQLGNVYQVLSARGVNVDVELPWIRPWFLRYQMTDGGMNCDNDAYLVQDECPSSMVGTIAVFEAVLKYTPRAWTAAEETFLSKAAQFLISRQLHLGSSTRHNAAERESSKSWIKLCFPRFYFYDVLRGLSVLTLWAEKTRVRLPDAATNIVTSFLESAFQDDNVRIGRQAHAGATTIRQIDSGAWTRKHPADSFPLLDAVSCLGAASPYLREEWLSTKKRLSEIAKTSDKNHFRS